MEGKNHGILLLQLARNSHQGWAANAENWFSVNIALGVTYRKIRVSAPEKNNI